MQQQHEQQQQLQWHQQWQRWQQHQQQQPQYAAARSQQQPAQPTATATSPVVRGPVFEAVFFCQRHVIQYELVSRPDQAYIVQDFSPDVQELQPWPASWLSLPRQDQAAVQFVQDLAQVLRSGRSLLVYDRQGILTQ